MAEKSPGDEVKNLLCGDLPELGPGPRANVLPISTLNHTLDELFAKHQLCGNSRELIRGLAFLWHDHLDEAHVIAQEVEGADGSFLHGIVHRREPDYGNAEYWFRRVGAHPCFSQIARRVEELADLKSHATLRAEILRDGKWNPFGLIDACQKAAGKSNADPQVKLLRQIQAVEFEVLLEHFLGFQV
jgi:hypothetical protein